MNPDSPIKLVAELIDRPLYDSDHKYCGVVDDVEFAGGAAKELELKALLVGPGAYAGRLPAWAMWLVRKIAGNRLTRVPMDKVRSIGPLVHLECRGRDLGLHKSEIAAGKWVPRWGAL